MTEQQSKDAIKNDLCGAIVCCGELMGKMDEIDLNDIEWQLDRATRHLENAKTRLKNCDDY